jgi:hypothetical protein
LLIYQENLAEHHLLDLEEVSSMIKPALLDSWNTMLEICHNAITLSPSSSSILRNQPGSIIPWMRTSLEVGMHSLSWEGVLSSSNTAFVVILSLSEKQ